MSYQQLPVCLVRCIEVLADLRAQRWKELLTVANFHTMLAIDASVTDIQKDYEDICFLSVKMWVNESVFIASDIQYEYSRAVCQFGVPSCLDESYDSYPVFSTGYDIIGEVDEILLDQEALEHDVHDKNFDACNTVGSPVAAVP